MKYLPELNLERIRRLGHAVMHQWIKYYKWLYLVSFLLVLGYGVYEWHVHVRNYSWSDEEKKAYLLRTIEETKFQEKRFRDTLTHLDELRSAHERPLPITKDLFFGKKETDR